MKSGQPNIDETDRRILRELRENCRRSARELALAVGISPSSLIERMKRMEGARVITGYSANLDYVKLGYEFMAVVQISIYHGKLLEVQEKISKLQGVVAVYDVTGTQDSVAMVMCRSRAELSALVKKILGIPNVEKTNTSIILNVVKDSDTFLEA